MIRIRILQSLLDPIMLGDGIEITLEEDDIHFIDKDTANWLVESGVAEVRKSVTQFATLIESSMLTVSGISILVTCLRADSSLPELMSISSRRL